MSQNIKSALKKMGSTFKNLWERRATIARSSYEKLRNHWKLTLAVVAGFFLVVALVCGFSSSKEDAVKAEKVYLEAVDLYEAGQGKEAFNKFTKAAQLGNSAAQHLLFLHYTNLSTKETNEKKAAELNSKAAYWLVRSALSGDSKTQLFLGLNFFDVTQFDWWRSVQKEYWKQKEAPVQGDWLKMAAEQEEVEAQFALGTGYLQASEDEPGVDELKQQALYWLQIAAENKSAEAAYQLGYLYEVYKYGTPEEAIQYYKQAGDSLQMAAYRLGVCYREGKCGVKADEQESSKWFAKAAELGAKDAQNLHDEFFKDVDETPAESAQK